MISRLWGLLCVFFQYELFYLFWNPQWPLDSLFFFCSPNSRKRFFMFTKEELSSLSGYVWIDEMRYRSWLRESSEGQRATIIENHSKKRRRGCDFVLTFAPISRDNLFVRFRRFLGVFNRIKNVRGILFLAPFWISRIFKFIENGFNFLSTIIHCVFVGNSRIGLFTGFVLKMRFSDAASSAKEIE